MQRNLRGAATFALVLFGIAAGCGTTAPSVTITESHADSMVGRSAEQVAARLGPPLSRGAAGLVYETRRARAPVRTRGATVSLSGGGTTSGLSMGREIQTCRWTFRLGADGQVSRWDNAGTLCAFLR